MPDRLVLIGMMGAGKTVVGAALARRLHRPFVDLDAEIEARLGRAVAEVFASEGEPFFRATESTVLTEMLECDDDVVLAAGGGVVLEEANRRALGRHATVVWLRARPDTLVTRVGRGAARPLLQGDDVESRVRALHDERRPLYETTADLVVDADDLSPAEIAEVVVERLGDRSPVRGTP
ncbi:MAG TPA: shikimate kinase [Acidimicrobiales bacterium]|nr:shikimate kinase [Acidimicrobiales bacterium]